MISLRRVTCSKLISRYHSTITEAFIKEKIVPDVIDVAPNNFIEIHYPNEVTVHFGNELIPKQVKDIPSLYWKSNQQSLHLLCLIDPDAPSREKPEMREWQHWLVGNIPSNDVSKGETITEYVGAVPPQNSGFHRYVFLVFDQQRKIKFDEPHLAKTSFENRARFSIRNFALKYKLGPPQCGNFFMAKFNDFHHEESKLSKHVA